MRIFKKIMFIILALVPVLPLLLFAVCNVGNNSGVSMIPFGSFTVAPADMSGGPYDVNQMAVYVEKETIIFRILDGVIPSNGSIEIEDIVLSINDTYLGLPAGDYRMYVYDSNQDRFIVKVGGLYMWFSSVGISPPAYIVCAFAYLGYMFFLHIAFMIFDIIVFVPKKISEMLEG